MLHSALKEPGSPHQGHLTMVTRLANIIRSITGVREENSQDRASQYKNTGENPLPQWLSFRMALHIIILI